MGDDAALARPVPTTAVGEVPRGLLDAFAAYERALERNDLAALDAAFAAGPATLRADAAGLLVGQEAIAAFRSARGGIAPRTVIGLHVRMCDPGHAVIVSENEPAGGGAGVVTQAWALGDDGAWRIETAQVAATPAALARAVWRVVGDPLVAGAPDGPLAGETVAVKDLFAVQGFAVGGGVPAFLAEGAPEPVHATAVRTLLEAGASVTGIARTDEFAYSIAGQNPHYGTPPNPRHPGHLPGGSSSGPASAVALGQVTIGLATDTGGSIRIPASYQGLWGLRTTQGAVDHAGVLPLAPSFDTVGWLTRDAGTLARVAGVFLPDTGASEPGGHDAAAGGFAIAPGLLELVDHDVRMAFTALIARLVAAGAIAEPVPIGLRSPAAGFEAFRLVQAAEAWASHGAWVTAHPGALGEAVAARFAFAAGVDAASEATAREVAAESRARLDAALGSRVLLLPTAPSTAPSVLATAREIDELRTRTLTTTSIAGLTGRPAISAPLLRIGRGPVGLCLVGPRGSDLALVRLATALAAAGTAA